MINHRERFLACITGQPLDRPPFWLFWGPWETTWERWKREGMPEAYRSFTDVQEAFGAEPSPLAHVVPVNLGPCPRREARIVAQDENSITFYDGWGILRRDIKGRASMSEFLKFPVHDWASWIDYRDRWLDPQDPRRLEGDWERVARGWNDAGLPVQLSWYPDSGIFGPYRWLMGDEEGLIALHTQPELAQAIMEHLATLYLGVFARVVRSVRVDMIHLWEDMCYRGGPLISPRMWDRFLGPQYRRIQAFAREHGIPVISVDTDGAPDMIAPNMLRCGVNLLYPMEVAAGCDVNEWQERFPGLAMMGGIDKRVLALGPREIRRELERVRPAVRRGRYIPDLDHTIPDDVSWGNFCYYAQALRELTGLG